MVFLDGVGLGPDDPESNPFGALELPQLERLLGGRSVVRTEGPVETDRSRLLGVDATLGVDGHPQSGTGQAALLTGQNVPGHTGRHHGPYPDTETRELLRRHSLFHRLRAAGLDVGYLNAYPATWHERMERGTGRASAIARAAHLAEVPLRGIDDLLAERALSPCLTQRRWRERSGEERLPEIDARTAGERLARLAREHDFSLFEYYDTDVAGHRGDRERIARVLGRVDALLGGLADALDDDTAVWVTSDHGNVEDWRTRRHTLHPPIALQIGRPEAWADAESLQRVTDVAPAIRAQLGVD